MAHLQIEDRLKIETLLRAGHKKIEIAELLGRNKSTIYAEINRNSRDGKYVSPTNLRVMLEYQTN